MKLMKFYLCIFVMLFINQRVISQEKEIIHLWPATVPGEKESKQEPVISDDTSNNVIRISKVTDPSMIVYPANSNNSNGIGIIVCPGGAYNILAIDLEGYEIAEWLNKLGYTAFVLQYRVPDKQMGALQDLQRAIRTIRSEATKWKINPKKLGVIGFSAGGSLCARASTMYNEKTYACLDKKEELSSRPDFTLLIYPAYLDQGTDNSITPELTVNANTPPTFIFQTADDIYGNSSMLYGKALRDAHVPVELHILPKGGHGYGIRLGNAAAEIWPQLAEKWLSELIVEPGL